MLVLTNFAINFAIAWAFFIGIFVYEGRVQAWAYVYVRISNTQEGKGREGTSLAEVRGRYNTIEGKRERGRG